MLMIEKIYSFHENIGLATLTKKATYVYEKKYSVASRFSFVKRLHFVNKYNINFCH